MAMYTRIAALFFVLTALLMLLGYAIGLWFGDPLLFMLLGLILAGVMNFVSYYWSDAIVVRMSRAKIIQESENPTLYHIVEKVAQEAHIPMPKVGIVESQQPNAFATGRGPSRAVVVATSSILRTLTPEELEAVIGHEIGHVVRRDVLTSSIAATVAGTISYIGNIALYSMMLGASSRDRQGGNPVVLLVAAILIPLGATFVQLGISRSCEYGADEYGAKLTRNPAGLVSALEKISSRVATGSSATAPASSSPSPATASLWIVNPFRGHSLFEMFSTHPSMPNRIKRLRKVGQEIGVYVP